MKINDSLKKNKEANSHLENDKLLTSCTCFAEEIKSGNNEIVNNEIVNNEIVNNEIVNNEIVNNESGNNKRGNNRRGNNRRSNNKRGNNEIGNNESGNNEIVINEIVINESGNNEIVINEIVINENGNNEIVNNRRGNNKRSNSTKGNNRRGNNKRCNNKNDSNKINIKSEINSDNNTNMLISSNNNIKNDVNDINDSSNATCYTSTAINGTTKDVTTDAIQNVTKDAVNDSTNAVKGSTNAVKGSTNAVKGSTNAVKGSTNAVKGSTNAVKGSTNAVKGSTNAVKGSTYTIRSSSRTIKGINNNVRGSTRSIRGSPRTIKGITNTIRDSLHTIRDSSHIINDSSHIINDSSHIINDCSPIIRGFTSSFVGNQHIFRDSPNITRDSTYITRRINNCIRGSPHTIKKVPDIGKNPLRIFKEAFSKSFLDEDNEANIEATIEAINNSYENNNTQTMGNTTQSYKQPPISNMYTTMHSYNNPLPKAQPQQPIHEQPNTLQKLTDYMNNATFQKYLKYNVVIETDTSIEPNETIYVKNLNDRVKIEKMKKELKELFSKFGVIEDIVIMRSFWRKGQAWIIYDTIESATKALNAMQGYVLHDKIFQINYSYNKSDIHSKRDGTFVERSKEPKKPKQILERERVQQEIFRQMYQQYLEMQMSNLNMAQIDQLKQNEKIDYNNIDKQTLISKAQERAHEERHRQITSTSYSPYYNASLYQSIQGSSTIPNNVLFVENVVESVDVQSFTEILKSFDGFIDTRVIPQRNVAFIDFVDETSATYAMDILQNYELEDSKLKISYAKK